MIVVRKEILQIVYSTLALLAILYFLFSIGMVFYLGNGHPITSFFGVSFLLSLPFVAIFSFLASNPDENPILIIIGGIVIFAGLFAYGFARGYLSAGIRMLFH